MALSRRKLKLRSKRNRRQINCIRIGVSITDLSSVMSLPIPDDHMSHKSVMTDDVFRSIKESLLSPEVILPPHIKTPEQLDEWLMSDKWITPELRAAIGDINVEDAYPKPGETE